MKEGGMVGMKEGGMLGMKEGGMVGMKEGMNMRQGVTLCLEIRLNDWRIEVPIADRDVQRGAGGACKWLMALILCRYSMTEEDSCLGVASPDTHKFDSGLKILT